MSWLRRKYSEPPVPRNSSRLASVPGSAAKPSIEKRCSPKLVVRFRLIVQVAAVQAAIDVRELVVRVVDLEVAPQRVTLVARQLHVELAERRRDFFHDRVVAERRIVIVRIDAPEQRVGRLVEEVAEQLVDRTFARVGARAQAPVLVELAVHVEREAAVQRRVVVIRRVLALQQIGRTARVRLGHRHVGDADVEPVVALELEIAQKHRAVASSSSTATSTVCMPAGRISSARKLPSGSTGTGLPATHTL